MYLIEQEKKNPAALSTLKPQTLLSNFIPQKKQPRLLRLMVRQINFTMGLPEASEKHFSELPKSGARDEGGL